jgi:hypothetical protein
LKELAKEVGRRSIEHPDVAVFLAVNVRIPILREKVLKRAGCICGGLHDGLQM